MTGAAAWLMVAAPALAGAAGLLLSFKDRVRAAALAVFAAGLAWIAAAGLVVANTDTVVAADWARFGNVTLTVNVKLSPTSTAVALAVVTVALLVQVYSIAHQRDDDRYVPYAAQISIFTAAMLLVVTADDLIVMLIGWEVMGACSYLLIGHDRRLAQAPAAAIKAFLVTRFGDAGFLMGVLLLGLNAGTFRVSAILASDALDPAVVTAASVLILAGAVGKSAQFPLHTWLPDAMAGPTPISALIHAATMVAAGVYVLVRLLPLYPAPVLDLVAVIAAVSMLLAACAALTTHDLKRVLAWSTVSQVAFMFVAVAVSAPDAAVFHLLSHAGFKALLFLAAGVVIGMTGHNTMARIGGLRRAAPVTFWALTLGFAALAGIPPLSGFWSKEAIMTAAAQNPPLFIVAVVTVVLTAAYCTRAWLLTCFGDGNGDATPDGRVRDPEPLRRGPLIVLAVPSVAGGAIAWSPVVSSHNALNLGYTAIVFAATACGVAASYGYWRLRDRADPADALGRAGRVFAAGFHFDALQHRLVVRPLLAVATVVRFVDERVVDGVVEHGAKAPNVFAKSLAATQRLGLPGHLVSTVGGIVVVAVVSTACTVLL